MVLYAQPLVAPLTAAPTEPLWCTAFGTGRWTLRSALAFAAVSSPGDGDADLTGDLDLDGVAAFIGVGAAAVAGVVPAFAVGLWLLQLLLVMVAAW
eukprot:s112_g39.t1